MKRKPTLAAAAVVALLAAGCSRGGSSGENTGGATPSNTPRAAAAGDFGGLKGVCKSGTASGSPAQGVTASTIKVGVFSDVGFTKNPEYVNAAKVFTSWCNDAGGINGRKLSATIRDTKIFEVPQQVAKACREDFAMVGGSSALDGAGTKARLSCLLPAFPAQTSSPENTGADLQLEVTGASPSYGRYKGYHDWLLKDAYPASASSVGIINGDSPITKFLGGETEETLKSAGATITYNDLYPAVGVSDWTPYAQAMKNKKVRGLVFLGDFTQLSKLEQVLTNINYKPDWIDANNNAYNASFIKLAGGSASAQNNLADLSGVYPLEKASDNPATKQVVDLYKKYAPSAQVTLPALRAFAAWLLFAKSATSCGNDLTRQCLYTTASKESAWTGGGLQAPIDLTKRDAPNSCFNIEHATPSGWEPAAFKPNSGAYRCGQPAYKFTGNYGKPLTLADVGKSLSDLK